jgi:hypothetical protein
MKTRFMAAVAAVASLAALGASGGHVQAQGDFRTVWVVTKDGRSVEGKVALSSLTFTVNGAARKVALRDLRSFHSADAASPEEATRITQGLVTVQGKDFKAAEAAAADLTDLGLPVLSPLLAAYKDVDGREPDPLYRLFGRIVPGFADASDRKLDLIRFADGGALRGRLSPVELKLTGPDGKSTVLPAGSLRRLAVRQPSVERTFEMQALRHCTYVSWFDTGVATTPSSRLQADSAGYVRLSFDEDGWSSDPDGIETPLPGKRKLQEGFRWGVVLGKVGATGERWLAGKHVEKTGLGAGRLFMAINDNEHWQNNIGAYRVRLRVTDAYDVGEPQ